MTLVEMNNKSIAQLSAFGDILLVVSLLVGMMIFMAGLLSLKRYADNPQETSLGQSLIYLMFGVLIIILPQVAKKMGDTVFPDESVSSTYATTPVESKPYVEPIVIKKPEPVKPIVAKKVVAKVPEKPVDYKQFFIVSGSIAGVIAGVMLSIFGVIQLSRKLKIRKYQKIVSGVVELNNDFVTLSAHIGTIESCLDDMKRFRMGAPNKIKSLLDGMQNILEHKKQMFNKSVMEIHETQPELRVLGGLV